MTHSPKTHRNRKQPLKALGVTIPEPLILWFIAATLISFFGHVLLLTHHASLSFGTPSLPEQLVSDAGIMWLTAIPLFFAMLAGCYLKPKLAARKIARGTA